MPRDYYLDLARRGLRMPIGADLVLHSEDDPETIKRSAERLGAIVQRTALGYNTPLAFPLMDLTLEKADLLAFLGVPAEEAEPYHFECPPSLETLTAVRESAARSFPPRHAAQHDAIRYIAEQTSLLPIGMVIGPFSLMTKLVKDPIPAVALAGAGTSAAQDEGVDLVERCLKLAEFTIHRAIGSQIAAGAKAMLVCEPAANTIYISPRQLRTGSSVFEHFVLEPNRRIRKLLEDAGVDLIFHDCGELTTDMVRQFANGLHPAILSLGSSRKLWDDASVVPDDVVLFGNLPTKLFYSDSVMPIDDVRRLTVELVSKMRATGHPHIVGSECDVLYVADAAESIRCKVAAMLAC